MTGFRVHAKSAPRNDRTTALRAVQRNRSAAEGAVRADRNGLPVTCGANREIRVEPGRTGNDLEIAVAAAALNVAADVAAGFAPGAREHAAAGNDVAGKIEAIAVAGAGQTLVEAIAAIADRVGRTAADAFAGSIIKGDGAAAGPVPGHAGKVARLGVACRAEQHRPGTR